MLYLFFDLYLKIYHYLVKKIFIVIVNKYLEIIITITFLIFLKHIKYSFSKVYGVRSFHLKIISPHIISPHVHFTPHSFHPHFISHHIVIIQKRLTLINLINDETLMPIVFELALT